MATFLEAIRRRNMGVGMAWELSRAKEWTLAYGQVERGTVDRQLKGTWNWVMRAIGYAEEGE